MSLQGQWASVSVGLDLAMDNVIIVFFNHISFLFLPSMNLCDCGLWHVWLTGFNSWMVTISSSPYTARDQQ